MASHFSTDDPQFDETDAGMQPLYTPAPYCGDDYSKPYGGYVYGPDGSRSGKRKPGHGKKVAMVVAIVVAVILVAGGAYGFALYNSVKTVKADAATAMAQVSTLKKSIKDGDGEALKSSVTVVANSTDAIYREVTSPLWNVATFIPVVGEDVKSAQTLVSAAKNLVNNALEPLSNEIAGVSLSSLVSDGAINAELISSLCSSGLEVLPVVEDSVNQINSLPDAHISQVAAIINKVKEPLASSGDIIAALRPALENLPRMVGSEGARTYLVIAQNNAEFRATGGLPGSWGTITVDNGYISMGEFTSILHQEGLSVAITEEEQAAIATNMDTDPAQVNCTADFVRVGEMSREYWLQATEQEVDGVVTIDPVFLQRLVGLVGGFTAEDGTEINGDNCARVLMSDSYATYKNDNEAQDAFFSSVASTAFDHVMGNLGNIDSNKLVDVIKKSGEDHRLMVWMANADEEALVKALGFSGDLQTDVTKPEVGVYVNDDTWSKIDWYAKLSTTVGPAVKNADGTTSYTVQTDLTNTLTLEETGPISNYVLGYNTEKRDDADMRSYLFIYSPYMGTLSNIEVTGDGLVDEGSEIPVNTLEGCQVARLHVHTGGGATTTVTYTVTVPAEATESLTVRMTPLANESLAQ